MEGSSNQRNVCKQESPKRKKGGFVTIPFIIGMYLCLCCVFFRIAIVQFKLPMYEINEQQIVSQDFVKFSCYVRVVILEFDFMVFFIVAEFDVWVDEQLMRHLRKLQALGLCQT